MQGPVGAEPTTGTILEVDMESKIRYIESSKSMKVGDMICQIGFYVSVAFIICIILGIM